MKAPTLSSPIATMLAITIFHIANATHAETIPAMNTSSGGVIDGTAWCNENLGKKFPAEGGYSRSQFNNLASEFIMNKDIPYILSLYESLSKPDCIFADGRPRLETLNSAAYQGFLKNPDWAKNSAIVDFYKKNLPNHPLAVLIEAEYWRAYAWQARGTGYASTVTKEGWILFKDRLGKSLRALEAGEGSAKASPLWYQEMITVLNQLDEEPKRKVSLIQESARKFPWYPTIFTEQLFYLLPKWGGSWEEISAYANWASSQKTSWQGDMMYARLYWSAAVQSNQENVLLEAKPVWKRVQSGFVNMESKFPGSVNILQANAILSCQVQDTTSYKRARNLLDKLIRQPGKFDPRVVPDFSQCDAKLHYRPS